MNVRGRKGKGEEREEEKRHLAGNRGVSDRTAEGSLGYLVESKSRVSVPKARPSGSCDNRVLR